LLIGARGCGVVAEGSGIVLIGMHAKTKSRGVYASGVSKSAQSMRTPNGRAARVYEPVERLGHCHSCPLWVKS